MSVNSHKTIIASKLCKHSSLGEVILRSKNVLLTQNKIHKFKRKFNSINCHENPNCVCKVCE